MKKLTESLEKYLLAIYELVKKQDIVKVKDVSQYLKIGGPSTADAIRTLAEREFIDYVPYGEITITTKGKITIENKINRRNTISKFLNQVLDIDETLAKADAKAIEYSMTEDVLDKFVFFLNFMEQCTCKEPKWIKSCKHNLKNGNFSTLCKECMKGNTPICCGSCCENS